MIIEKTESCVSFTAWKKTIEIRWTKILSAWINNVHSTYKVIYLSQGNFFFLAQIQSKTKQE